MTKPINKRELTSRYLQTLKPPARAELIWDAKQGGLALSVRPSGRMIWKVIYSLRSRTRWLTLGPTDRIGLSDARKFAARIMLQVIEGRDPAAEKQAQRGAGTFAELVQRYFDEYASKRNKSWRHSQ